MHERQFRVSLGFKADGPDAPATEARLLRELVELISQSGRYYSASLVSIEVDLL